MVNYQKNTVISKRDKQDHGSDKGSLARDRSHIGMASVCGGRPNSLMPVAQFNQFEKLDKPIIRAGGEADAYKFWHRLSDVRNQ
jgi:hypothetical protein